MRIEDTDRTRLVEDAVDRLLEIHEIFSMTPDEWPHRDGGVWPYTQSERLHIYQPRLHKLCEDGTAYYCFCSNERLAELHEEQTLLKIPPRYDGACRHIPYEEAKLRVDTGESYTIRLKVPKAEKLVFDDLVLGHLEFNTSEVDDQVLLKSDGFPTYHGAVVIDDSLMNITHVLRWQEWTSSLPKQILTARALGIELPRYGHVPWVLGNDGKKLSKRTGDVSVAKYLENGYLPEALLNYLVLLGWHPKNEKEIMSLDAMIAQFDITDIHRAGAVFDPVKLDWMNGEYIRALDTESLHVRLSEYLKKYEPDFYREYALKDFSYNAKVITEVQPRMKRLGEFSNHMKTFYSKSTWDISLLINPKMKVDTLEEAKLSLLFALTVLEGLDFTSLEWIKNPLLSAISEAWHKNGVILWPLRVALTGVEHSPWAFECASILGKTETLHRIWETLSKIR